MNEQFYRFAYQKLLQAWMESIEKRKQFGLSAEIAYRELPATCLTFATSAILSNFADNIEEFWPKENFLEYCEFIYDHAVKELMPPRIQ